MTEKDTASSPFIWTEVFNCGKIGRAAIESFLAHHDLSLHVFGFEADLAWIPESTRVHRVTMQDGIGTRLKSWVWRSFASSTPTLSEAFVANGFRKGHLGTARLWSFLIQSRPEKHMIHFDSDVIFLGDVLSEVIDRLKECELVGPIRHYEHNPNKMDEVRRLEDVVATSCFGFDRTRISKHSFGQLVKMVRGFYNPLGHPVIDFFDPVSFEIRSRGGRVCFLDPNDVGGMTLEGTRKNRYPEWNDYPTPFKIDFGSKLVHFSAVGSGMNVFNNGAPEVPEHYRAYALDRYALFCKVFYGEDLGIPLDYYGSLIGKLEEIDQSNWTLA